MSDQDGSADGDQQPREPWTKRAGWARPRGSRRARRQARAGLAVSVAQGVTNDSSSGTRHDFGASGQATARGRGRGGFRGRGSQEHQDSAWQIGNTAVRSNATSSRSDGNEQQEQKDKNLRNEDDSFEVAPSPDEEVDTGGPSRLGAGSTKSGTGDRNKQDEVEDIGRPTSDGK